MRSYLQHGRRHAADGSDPIPGLTAAAANLPWGYCRYDNASFPSGTGLTQIDFNQSVGGFGGYTSGDADITFGDNGSGRYSLIINTTGYYLMATGVLCQVSSSPAAGSGAQLNSQWLPGRGIVGSVIQPFTQLLTGSFWDANPSSLDVYNADGVIQPVPKAGNTSFAQNSGVSAAVHIYMFAVKISNVSVGFNQ